jgi:membrane-associated phospholipid phosphatase
VNQIYGEALLRELAARSQEPVWVAVWTAVSFLGSATFFTVLVPALFALAPASFALRCTARIMLSAWMAELLKWWIGRPRLDPLQLGATTPLEHAGIFENDAFPSGHALMGVVVWIGLARERSSVRLWLAAWLLVLLIAFSRLALLRHDLLDVGAGLLMGAALSWTMEWLRLRLRSWSTLPWVELAGLWVIAGILAQRCVPTDSAAIVSGVLAGAGFGSAQNREKAAASAKPSLLLILLLNLAGVAVARLAAEHYAVGRPILLWLLYALAGWWIAGITPRLKRSA